MTELYRQGPLRIVLRKDTEALQIVGTCDGKRYRVGAGIDLRQAKRKLADLLFEIESGWRPGRTQGDWDKVVSRIHARHKWSAKHRGIPFSIGEADVYALMTESGFRCPLSGIAFSKAIPAKGDLLSLRDPWAPSIDRIDNRQGYIQDNVRVVCVAANMAMNAWGYDTLLRLARGVVRNAGRAAVPEAAALDELVTDLCQPKTNNQMNGLQTNALAF